MIYVIEYYDYEEGGVAGVIDGPNNVDMKQMYQNFLKESKWPKDGSCKDLVKCQKALEKKGISGVCLPDYFVNWLLIKHKKNYKRADVKIYSVCSNLR